MISLETVNQIKEEPVAERLKIIEALIQLLKDDIPSYRKKAEGKSKPFRTRQISLGREVHVDRNELYAARDF